MEICLVDAQDPPEWTQPSWHEQREWVPQYGTAVHTPRIRLAAEMVQDAVHRYGVRSVVELGAHDGGMCKAMGTLPWQVIPAPRPTYHGYEITDAALSHAVADGIDVRKADILRDELDLGEHTPPNLVVLTEVLEHLAQPHELLRRLQPRVDYLLASVPIDETRDKHYEYHAWAWDRAGFSALLAACGYVVLGRRYLHQPIGTQVALCRGGAP